jgi:hypothetical protein
MAISCSLVEIKKAIILVMIENPTLPPQAAVQYHIDEIL